MLDEGRGSQVPVELGGDIDSLFVEAKGGDELGHFCLLYG
jgi:hypothetical protein